VIRDQATVSTPGHIDTYTNRLDDNTAFIPTKYCTEEMEPLDYGKLIIQACADGELPGLHTLLCCAPKGALLPPSVILLYEAASHGQVDTVKYLFDTLPGCQGDNPWDIDYAVGDRQDQHGNTLPKVWYGGAGRVVYAIFEDKLGKNNQLKTLKAFLKRGLKVDYWPPRKDSLIKSAMFAGATDCVEYLLKKDAAILMHGQDTVCEAARLPNTEMLELIHKYVPITRPQLLTAAMENAIRARSINNVEWCLEKGADPTTVARPGGSTLHIAVWSVVWQREVQPDQSPYSEPEDSRRVLVSDDKSSLQDMLKLLLKYGARVDKVNRAGKTALDMALQNHLVEAANLLTEAWMVELAVNEARKISSK
jgi:ankyrin repeat protein